MSPFMLDLLEIIKDLIYSGKGKIYPTRSSLTLPFSEESRYISRVTDCLLHYELREIILTILHGFAFKKHQKADSKIPNIDNDPEIQDKIIEKCLDIAKKIVFEACKDKQNAKLPKEIKSADLTPRRNDVVLDNYLIIGSTPHSRVVRKGSINYYYKLYGLLNFILI